MPDIREQAAAEYLTKLRELRDADDIDCTVFNAVRAFVEGLDRANRDDAVTLNAEQYKGLEWTLGLLTAYDRVERELLHRAKRGAFVMRTILDSDTDDAEQERAGALSEW